jgi:hypothetical protein
MPVLNPQHYNPLTQGSAMRGPTPPPPLTQKDLTFVGRYPDLKELMPERNTYAGCWYCYIPAEFLSDMLAVGMSELQGKHGGRVEPFRIHGKADDPSTHVNTVLLMTYGEPILGTQGNGKRRVLIHPALVEKCGIDPDPSQHLQNGKVTPEMVEAVRTQGASR